MKEFTGIRSMMAFILKKDKISLFFWILILPTMPLVSISALAKLYTDEASLLFFMKMVESDPLQMSMLGKILAPNIGAAMCWKWLTQSSIFSGIFNLFFIIKHTRSEEASGRYEMLSATSIGRYAITGATFGVALMANFLMGTLASLYLLGYGQTFAGSLAVGLGLTVIGVFMASLSIFVAQLTSEAGTAKGIIGACIALFYILNIAYNSGLTWLFYLSPITWLYKLRPFATENWWVLLLPLGASIMLSLTSYHFLSQRDLNTGILQFENKKKTTSPYFNNIFALVWRLHSNMIFWWTISFLVFGILLGAMMDTVAIQMGENPQFKAFLSKMGDFSIADVMFSLMFTLFAQIYAFYIIMAISKLAKEEIENRSEIVLALPISRIKWALSHLGIVFIGMTLLLLAFGGGAGFFYGYMQDNIFLQTRHLLSAAWVFLPALACFWAFSFLIFAIFPKHYYISWISLVLIVILDFLRELLPDYEWITKISPFSHVPKILLQQTNYGGLMGLSLVSLCMLGTALFFYRKRDMV